MAWHLFSFTLFLSLLAGCGRGIETRPLNAEDEIKNPLQFTISSFFAVSETKQTLYQRLRQKEPISFKGVTNALIEDHYRNWVDRRKNQRNPSFDQALKRIESFSASFSKGELGDIKEELESRVATVAGQPPVYNALSFSIFDIPYAKRMQAFSGTALLSIALRGALGKTKLEKSNLVVIYESGHVLPGYLTLVDGVWQLTGIETAVKNKGRVRYGSLKSALKQRLMRIVDAPLWALVELFKFEADDVVDMANQALRLTAQKYGIEDPAYLVASRFKREVDYGKLAWSPFTFGNPDIAPGDRSRASFEEQERAKLPRTNPNITILHQSKPLEETPTPTVKEKAQSFESPAYPYKEVADPSAPDGKRFYCWHYIRREWVPLVHQKKPDQETYVIRFNPCAISLPNYEPVPPPLKLEPPVYKPPPLGGRGYLPGYDD